VATAWQGREDEYFIINGILPCRNESKADIKVSCETNQRFFIAD